MHNHPCGATGCLTAITAPCLHGNDHASSARLVMRVRRANGVVLNSGTISCSRAPCHDGIKAASEGLPGTAGCQSILQITK
jgi:hypothetical protein